MYFPHTWLTWTIWFGIGIVPIGLGHAAIQAFRDDRKEHGRWYLFCLFVALLLLVLVPFAERKGAKDVISVRTEKEMEAFQGANKTSMVFAPKTWDKISTSNLLSPDTGKEGEGHADQILMIGTEDLSEWVSVSRFETDKMPGGLDYLATKLPDSFSHHLVRPEVSSPRFLNIGKYPAVSYFVKAEVEGSPACLQVSMLQSVKAYYLIVTYARGPESGQKDRQLDLVTSSFWSEEESPLVFPEKWKFW